MHSKATDKAAGKNTPEKEQQTSACFKSGGIKPNPKDTLVTVVKETHDQKRNQTQLSPKNKTKKLGRSVGKQM